jgi:hypothetical protein
MSLKRTLLAASVLSVSFNANAALISYTGAGSVGLVYSGVSDITWTQDANLFKTLYDADNTVIDQIVSLTPWINDGYQGGNFNSENGLMNWWGAQAFVSYLNNITYGGSQHWRLPTSNAIYGYNGTAGNELGQLFYKELGGTAYSSIPDTSIFINEQTYIYWSGTDYVSPAVVWGFDTYHGFQSNPHKFDQFYTWAVSPGQVAAVPAPAAVWLIGSGLIGFFGLKRRAPYRPG